MPDTYSQIHIHVVFAVKGRISLINHSWEDELYKYITGIIKNKGQKLLAINGMPDHIHFLIGMRPNCNLSDLVREIKKSSNEMINSEYYREKTFAWQEGFGAFSFSKQDLDAVIKYIINQKEHHRVLTFREEYINLLEEMGVEYKHEYLFEWIK
ncbi:MAG: hypothetical protein FMNOHCHN_00783 [Ignavibacteriaceae bacterium]|nr:hypothetical protein [Ignavibacteriaceae bacterium]